MQVQRAAAALRKKEELRHKPLIPQDWDYKIVAYVCAKLGKCMQDSHQLKSMTLLTLASTQGQVQFILGGEEGNRNNAVDQGLFCHDQVSSGNFLEFFNLWRNLQMFLDPMEPRTENKNSCLDKTV